MLKVRSYPLHTYTDLIAAGRPFSFARYGDGEWLAMLGAQGANCDKHDYFPELGEDLRRAVAAQRRYFYAIGPKATHMPGRVVEQWLEHNGVSMVWHSTEVWLEASLRGGLAPLTEALRQRRLLYVGPLHLQPLVHRALGGSFLEVPIRNCYLHKVDLLEQLYVMIESMAPEVICFSAGMTTNVLIDQAWQLYGEQITMIDMGSVLDVYAGVKSRKYMQKGFDWETLAKLNGLAPARPKHRVERRAYP